MVVSSKRFDRRKQRVRAKIRRVNPDILRLSVYRSGRHFYAQVIDDKQGCTLVAASTQEASIQKQCPKTNTRDAAKAVGTALAARAKEKNVTRMAFDKGGYRYHGRVAAFAEAVRNEGLTL